MVYECEACEAALPPGSLFCPRCGEKFDDPVPVDAEWVEDAPEPSSVRPEAGRKPGKRGFLIGAVAAGCLLLVFLIAGAVTWMEGQKSTVGQAGSQDEEAAYVAQVHDHSQRIAQCLFAFGQLYGERTDDPDWLGNIDHNLQHLKLLAEEGKALHAPDSLRDVQQQYAMAMEDYSGVADSLPDALRRKDQAALTNCFQRLRDAQQSVGRARTLLNRQPAMSTPSQNDVKMPSS